MTVAASEDCFLRRVVLPTLDRGVAAPFDDDDGGNCAAAAQVGKNLADRAKEAGIQRVVFDRNGYRFHGRVKALADAAREGGLKF